MRVPTIQPELALAAAFMAGVGHVSRSRSTMPSEKYCMKAVIDGFVILKVNQVNTIITILILYRETQEKSQANPNPRL